MLRLIARFLFSYSKPERFILGRWGYHWEINKNVQKYYD
jgi:hypothetical protein